MPCGISLGCSFTIFVNTIRILSIGFENEALSPISCKIFPLSVSGSPDGSLCLRLSDTY